MSKNVTYTRYSEFFGTRKALILDFLQSRRIAIFYGFIKLQVKKRVRRKPPGAPEDTWRSIR